MDLKLYNPQPKVASPVELRKRLAIAKMYLALTHEMRSRLFNAKRHNIRGTDLETLLVLIAVFIGEAEQRPTTPTKIASHSGIPRGTVYRRLNDLIKLKKVVKVGHNYHLAQDALTADKKGRLMRILEASKVDTL
jgi:hypothetical protein